MAWRWLGRASATTEEMVNVYRTLMVITICVQQVEEAWKVPTFHVKPFDGTMNLRVTQVVIKLSPCESAITGIS